MNAKRMAIIIPIKYNMNIIKPWFLGKKAPVKSTYTGNLALHDMKGDIRIVSNLSFFESRDLVAIIAGTVHPNPNSNGMKDFP